MVDDPDFDDDIDGARHEETRGRGRLYALGAALIVLIILLYFAY